MFFIQGMEIKKWINYCVMRKVADNVYTQTLLAGFSTLKEKWVVGNVKSGVQTETIHFQRKSAIAKFLERSSMTWKECMKCR